ncbi:hypothetical protein IFM89_038952 [Coptis chinensis]|uniref:RING-type domain-containing protein n=1 Tax=Coptis chinensis TaxID=261450 RepID=A0A835IZS9_9MAGN|nr:hypothetical protein IFM89_038952 [Coptis chinensis]
MGSSTSKDASSSSSSVVRSMGTRVLHSSCLGLSHDDHLVKENDSLTLKSQPCRKVKDDGDRSSTEALPAPSLISSTRLRPRFSFIPANFTFRLSRAASLGSSRTYSLFSNGVNTANAQLPRVHSNPSDNCDSLPVTLDVDDSVHPLNDEIVSSQGVASNNENNLGDGDTSRNSIDIDSIGSRRANRRLGVREPVERSVRFSRTLSVGRLRDRVLRRSSFTDGLFGRLQEDREVRDSSQENERQVWDGMSTTLDSADGNAEISSASSSHPLSSTSTSMYNSQDYELETSRPREARYHDIMEHRTDFLERRRRIRSQVRALQRLGSRFENLSGHERSCILAGQHRSGRCTCRTSNRTRNPDDDTSAGASISRIVMLAEALFEVLDEIHQQSVVLSSRPSVSSLGSVPAPKEIVESMPVKIFTDLQKHQNEDVAQCYICLVEYEEGDCMRILPCHHEFHRTCIDKWLKDIHRNNKKMFHIHQCVGRSVLCVVETSANLSPCLHKIEETALVHAFCYLNTRSLLAMYFAIYSKTTVSGCGVLGMFIFASCILLASVYLFWHRYNYWPRYQWS